MGDLLFRFSGRIGRLGYLLALLCMGIAITLVIVLQNFLSDWKFGGIFITVATCVPLIIYLAATSKRFQDRGRHPALGFVLYFIAPLALIWAAQNFLGLPLADNAKMQTEVAELFNDPEWTPIMAAKWAMPVAAVFLFVFGQISLLARKGTAGENAFDVDEVPGSVA